MPKVRFETPDPVVTISLTLSEVRLLHTIHGQTSQFDIEGIEGCDEEHGAASSDFFVALDDFLKDNDLRG